MISWGDGECGLDFLLAHCDGGWIDVALLYVCCWALNIGYGIAHGSEFTGRNA